MASLGVLTSDEEMRSFASSPIPDWPASPLRTFTGSAAGVDRTMRGGSSFASDLPYLIVPELRDSPG